MFFRELVRGTGNSTNRYPERLDEARDSYLYRDLIDYDVRCCRHRYAESVFR